jgi:radical SAM protein with 4Fe4S-binding SPASM domain
MRSYGTEIYLPCKLPSLSYTSRRKPIPRAQGGDVVSLAPVSAIPFQTGGLLFFRDSAFFVDHFELLLDLNRATCTPDSMHRLHPEWDREIQELHAIGALKFDEPAPSLHYSKAAYRARTQYKGSNWINFAMAPIVLELDITNNCNAECVHCSREAGPARQRDLSMERIENILQQCEEYNIPELLVMGGEPLVHPSLANILRRARDHGVRAIRTSTNGISLTANHVDVLSEYASHVQVSIHGAVAETHDAITKRGGSFRKACNAVRALRAANVDVAISCTVMNENEGEIESLADLALGLGANTMRYLALSPVGRGRSRPCADIEWRDRIGARLRRISEQYEPCGLEIAVGGFPSLKPIQTDAVIYGCSAARTHFHIAFDFMSNPCGSVDGYQIGDMRERSILDAWHDPKMQGVRHATSCGCTYRHVCSGSCKADTDFAFH